MLVDMHSDCHSIIGKTRKALHAGSRLGTQNKGDHRMVCNCILVDRLLTK